MLSCEYSSLCWRVLNLAFLDRSHTLNEIIAQCLFRHVQYGTQLFTLIQGNVELAGRPIEEGPNGLMPLKPSEVDLMNKQAEGSEFPCGQH